MGCFLENYNLQVFDEAGPSLRCWGAMQAADVLAPLARDPIGRRLKRAVDDASQLVALARGGELDAGYRGFETTPVVARIESAQGADLALPGDWLSCLRALRELFARVFPRRPPAPSLPSRASSSS